MNNQKVSIIVPIYGAEKYIERCARSLFEQTYSNVEFVFVDDCTLDDSVNILLCIVEQYPKRKPFVKIIKHETNKGSAEARNTGLKNASGDFIIWVDADDYIELDTINVCINNFDDADIITFGTIKHTCKGDVIMNNFQYKNIEDQLCGIIKHYCHHGLWGRMYKRKISVNHNIYFFSGQNMGEDFQWVVRNFAYASKIKVIDKCLYHYDFMNMDSLVHKQSFKKKCQSKFNYDIVRKEVYGKSKMINEALDYKKTDLLVDLLELCCENNEGKLTFSSLHNEVKELPVKAKKHLVLVHRVMFTIKHYHIARLYLKLAMLGKKIIKNISK